MKVLFLDDEIVNLKLIELLGKSHPNISQGFHLSYEELEKDILSNGMPDVVVTDIRMPGTDGFEVVKKLSQEHPNIKTIYCSAFCSLKVALNETGFNEDLALKRPYYVKPIRQDLFELIMEVYNS